MPEETKQPAAVWPVLIGVVVSIVLQVLFGLQAYSALAQRVADLDNEVRRIEQWIDQRSMTR